MRFHPAVAMMLLAATSGLDRYGVPLRYDDGRPPGVDAFQEALDLGAYEMRDQCGVPSAMVAQVVAGTALRRVKRAALADAWWNLDTVQAAGLRAMVDAAVAGVDLPPGGRAAEREAAPSGGMVDLDAPCPFCGSAVGIVEAMSPGNGGGLQWFVLCPSCGCEGPWTKSETSALAAWSRRPPGGRAS
jgi:Lar family restriction alleviation protein